MLCATTQTKAVIYEKDYSIQASNSDIVVADLEGGAHFDSNTPDKDEHFLKMVNNDQTALYEEYDLLFHIARIMSVDVNTHATQDLFASERVTYINNNENDLRVFTEDVFGNHKFYLIDDSGAKQLLLATGPKNHIEYSSTPEVAAYCNYPDIVFKLFGTGATAKFVPPNPDPSTSYYLQGLTQAEAIVCGHNTTRTTPAFYHFDFATQTTTPIDLSTFPNWEGYWDDMVNGAGRLAIPGNDNVLFYNRANGTIEDLITPVIGAKPDNAFIIAKYGGKAVIRTWYQDANQNYINKVLYFDGTNVADTLPSHNDVWVNGRSNDGKYALLIANNFDLVLFDVEAGTSQAIYNGLIRNPMLSPDSSIVVYTAYDTATNETVVNVYDIAAKTTRELSRKTSMICQIYDISKDNSTVIIGRDYGIFSINTATGNETFIAYE
ncbi:MAG: hypothetical protein QXT19_02315 [Candidatus Woesearchaeota archaeon]